MTERLNKREILNAPFRKLAPDFAPWVARADFVVSDDRWLAGNLRLWFPDKVCISPDLVPYYAPAGRSCLLVWEVTQGPEPPAALVNFARSFAGKELPGPFEHVQEVWKYHESKSVRFGLVRIER